MTKGWLGFLLLAAMLLDKYNMPSWMKQRLSKGHALFLWVWVGKPTKFQVTVFFSGFQVDRCEMCSSNVVFFQELGCTCQWTNPNYMGNGWVGPYKIYKPAYGQLRWWTWKFLLLILEISMRYQMKKNKKWEPTWHSTLPKTNLAPGRRPSQMEIHLPTPVFQVLC